MKIGGTPAAILGTVGAGLLVASALQPEAAPVTLTANEFLLLFTGGESALAVWMGAAGGGMLAFLSA